MEKAFDKTINDYEIIKDLGSGSFGQVRLVKSKINQKIFALKTVSLVRLTQKQKDNALNQIRLLASFDIPTIIKYQGSFYNKDTQELCILMQYADGGDLQQKITKRDDQMDGQGFEEPFVWKVAYQILKGLKILHQNNVIHRDVKSANIFFVQGVAKLGDLNVSKLTQNGLCSTNTGTPYYNSPQIWKGLQYNNKCDVWATGCIVYELCTLKNPFKSSDFPTLFRKVIKGQYKQIPSKYSEEMKQLVKLCLTVQPEMRPSVSQLLNLKQFNNIQEISSKNIEKNQVQFVHQIKCPKILKFLNSRLPKPRNEHKQKTVAFASRDYEKQAQFFPKQNFFARKIRSQKSIKFVDEDQLKVPKKYSIKPHAQSKTSSQKSISGLTFSTKRIKLKIQSSKLISDQSLIRVL